MTLRAEGIMAVWNMASAKKREPIDLNKTSQPECEARDKANNQLSEELNDAGMTKRQKFLDIPSISFHFADEDQIRSFYNDYFKEPTIENLVSEIAGEISGEINAGIPQVLESRVGGKDLSKWISTIKLPELSLEGMFRRYQRETIEKGQVTLGMEEVDIGPNELHEFEDAVKDLDRRFSFKLDENLLNSQRAILKEKIAESTLIKLEQATDWILIEGRFKITKENDLYKCIHTHKINEYILGSHEKVTISVFIPEKSLKSHILGNYAQSIGQMIPLKIYGKVWRPIDRTNNIWDLQITPIAIY
jgi:hypothetical protein